MHKEIKREKIDIFIDDSGAKSSATESRSYLAKNLIPPQTIIDNDLNGNNLAATYVNDQSGDINTSWGKKTEILLQKITEKNAKIEKLCELLEVMEPVPGFDAEKYRRIIESNDQDNIDYRDSKIVALAKKSHRLSMSLNKEKAGVDLLNQQIAELQSIKIKLQQQLAEASNQKKNDIRMHRTVAVDPNEIEKDNEAQVLQNLTKELRESNKVVDEQKKKIQQLLEENKNLTRTLSRELGEGVGVGVEQAVDGGWRGRAQQIVMLKAKVKKLESMISEKSTKDTTENMRAITLKQGNDVDSKAESDLREMGNERRKIVEALTEERVQLLEEQQSLESKISAQKARIRNLEGEIRKLKDNLQIVLDKSATDDQLLDALKAENKKLQSKLISYNNNVANTIQRELLPEAPDVQRLQSEVKRLQRLCKNQQEQLDSQDATIQDLKRKL